VVGGANGVTSARKALAKAGSSVFYVREAGILAASRGGQE